MKDNAVKKTSSKKTCNASMADIMFYIAGPKSFDNEILADFMLRAYRNDMLLHWEKHSAPCL
jgi:hypothetical protein